MTGQPGEKPDSFWQRLCHDPRYFCGALMLFSIIGFFVCVAVASPHASPSTMHIRVIAGAILVSGIVLGFIGMIFSLIPPVRRFLTTLLQRRFFWLAGAAVFITLLYAEENWSARHALKKYEDRWAAQGVKFNFPDVIPPPVPDDQNFALTPIVYSSYASCMDKQGHEIVPHDYSIVNRLAMLHTGPDMLADAPKASDWRLQTLTDLHQWQNYYRTLAAKTNQFAIPTRPGLPASDVLLALAKYDSDIEELRQASQLPQSRFPLTYNRDDPEGILLPHLSGLKMTARMLDLRACAALQNGENDKALADVRLMLYLGGSIRSEPFAISSLVRFALLDVALQPVYEGLAAHRWSDTQLVALDADLARLDFLTDCQQVMRGELGFRIADTEYMRRSRDFSALMYSPDGTQNIPTPLYIVMHLAPGSFFYRNELQLSRMGLEYLLPSMDLENRTISPDTVQQKYNAALSDFLQRPWGGVLPRMVMPGLISATTRFAQAQSHLDLARVAIALERYRLAHGKLPVSLLPLSPQYLTTIPSDVIDGQSLRYKRTGDDRFVLYSVGWNQTDDGGEVGLSPGTTPELVTTNGDWVWKYPVH